MTLVFGWLRNTGALHEFVVASDSRLSGDGTVWDTCPKVLQLPRSDAVIAFAGSTAMAYPALLQIQGAIAANPASVERRYDVTQLASHVQDVLNQLVIGRKPDVVMQDGVAMEKAETHFLLAGYSWRYGDFRAWRYRHNPSLDRYERHPVRSLGGAAGGGAGTRYAVLGDAAGRGRKRLSALLELRGRTPEQPLNMEPLEVLRDLIREGDFPSVGGAPQVVKIYRHLNSEPFGVLWRPRADSAVAVPTYKGRPLLEYEKAFFKFIDIDDPERHAAAAARPGTQVTLLNDPADDYVQSALLRDLDSDVGDYADVE